MSLEDTDAAAKAVQKTPNRIPLKFIESRISEEIILPVPGAPHMTVMVMHLDNGFYIVGKSAPADPDNFDPELGKKFAREDCIRQAWPLYAFALLCDMSEQSVMEDIRDYAPPQAG